jgi:putative component of membrane protein insertase Oxa1/YidC/SpoIIIJ protein YidD
MGGDPSSFLSRLALWAIRLYQRHLSPIKGFSCAYRVATGANSCSQHGYRVIARHGLALGLPLLQRRLRRCGESHRSLANRRPVPNPVLHYQRGDCDLLACGCDGVKPPGAGRCLGELACNGACDVLGHWYDRLRGRQRRRNQNAG